MHIAGRWFLTFCCFLFETSSRWQLSHFHMSNIFYALNQTRCSFIGDRPIIIFFLIIKIGFYIYRWIFACSCKCVCARALGRRSNWSRNNLNSRKNCRMTHATIKEKRKRKRSDNLIIKMFEKRLRRSRTKYLITVQEKRQQLCTERWTNLITRMLQKIRGRRLRVFRPISSDLLSVRWFRCCSEEEKSRKKKKQKQKQKPGKKNQKRKKNVRYVSYSIINQLTST